MTRLGPIPKEEAPHVSCVHVLFSASWRMTGTQIGKTLVVAVTNAADQGCQNQFWILFCSDSFQQQDFHAGHC